MNLLKSISEIVTLAAEVNEIEIERRVDERLEQEREKVFKHCLSQFEEDLGYLISAHSKSHAQGVLKKSGLGDFWDYSVRVEVVRIVEGDVVQLATASCGRLEPKAGAC